MIQSKAVNKAMFWLKEQDLIKEEDRDLFRRYLNWLYVIGWEEGEKNANYAHKKRVKGYDKRGNYIGTFNCIVDAAKAVGCERHLITRSLKTGKPSLSGLTWQYVEDGTPKSK